MLLSSLISLASPQAQQVLHSFDNVLEISLVENLTLNPVCFRHDWNTEIVIILDETIYAFPWIVEEKACCWLLDSQKLIYKDIPSKDVRSSTGICKHHSSNILQIRTVHRSHPRKNKSWISINNCSYFANFSWWRISPKPTPSIPARIRNLNQINFWETKVMKCTNRLCVLTLQVSSIS